MNSSFPCIWMEAGVIDYRLCDRHGDCEGCPFDAALRGRRPSRADEAATALPAQTGLPSGLEASRPSIEPGGDRSVIAGFLFDRSLFYDRHHTWARVEGRGRVRVGLDDFARRLVAPLTSVCLPQVSQRVTRDSCSWRVVCDICETALSVPIAGTVVSVNAELLRDPALVDRDPYGKGACFEIEPHSLSHGLRRLHFGEEAALWYHEEAGRLRRELDRALPARTSVGPTMADGGAFVESPSRLLPPEAWRRLLSLFLGDRSHEVGDSRAARGEEPGRGEPW